MEEEKKMNDLLEDKADIDLESDPARRDFFTKVLAVVGAVAATNLLNTAIGEAADPPLEAVPLTKAAPAAPLPTPLRSGEMLQASNLSMKALGVEKGFALQLSGPQLSQALAREGLGVARGGQVGKIALEYSMV